MIKRYEWDMVLIADMAARDAEGWEYVSGPVWDTAGAGAWCLLRREVVPGRVHLPDRDDEPRETGTWDDGPLRNCWTCVHSNERATGCRALLTTGIYGWVDGTHSRDQLGRLLPCPPTADGCPGWTAKEVTP